MKLREFLKLYAGEETHLFLLSSDGELSDDFYIDEYAESANKIDKFWLNGKVNYFYFDDGLELMICVDIWGVISYETKNNGIKKVKQWR